MKAAAGVRTPWGHPQNYSRDCVDSFLKSLPIIGSKCGISGERQLCSIILVLQNTKIVLRQIVCMHISRFRGLT